MKINGSPALDGASVSFPTVVICKLLDLSDDAIEDALEIARTQNTLAAHNGLLGALIAEGGDDLRALIDKTECFHTPELGEKYEHRVAIAFENGIEVIQSLASPRNVFPGPSSEEILEKFWRFTKGVVDDRR
ncbi:uncharacterized protein N7498_006711 [Penicillium cinerascens]|uniref:Uncharacterized protein n=1 Tax=Penicillium cinerascens TaxID=70096 RepID=A0A9W9MIR3_9EURO|nr:uncharacterized protein N7498_006711 [Penicillium cinerascens]KAJ5202048.1 hypothetical protein N7498_006711 [Penicillium cinerascens]